MNLVIEMLIDNVKTLAELDSVMDLVFSVFPYLPTDDNKYSLSFWAGKMNELPELLLYAKDGEVICGSVFAWVDNGGVTVAHCCVAPAYRGQGIGRDLMLEIERRVKALGYHSIVLGSVEGAERFYEKLGYKGSLLIQSEDHSIDQLLSLNDKYEVIYTNVYEGTVNQVCLRLSSPDRELQRLYEKTFPSCTTQMVFGKSF
ncbi:MAG TPA: GNAT family N-acetyltransferase [Bacillota bacterium]|nr:GNAT family N-acetyltransferase [Bacillota bacterium]